MTKAAALHQWFNQFLPFYPASSVPDDVVFPYGTYELATSSWDSEEVAITVNLWYYTESESIPNAKADEIAKAIGLGGMQVICDDGVIWIKKGNPWCQSLQDSEDLRIKRRYLNITLEYNTF